MIGRRGLLASALVYVAATAVMGRDVLGALTTHLINDPGDPGLNAAILAWNAQRLPWTDAWYQFPIFFPARDALTFSEHLLGLSVIASPVYWITGNAIAAYNVTGLLTFPLCGLAMYALVFRLTGSAPAAFLAGLAYAFTPYRVVQLAHIQMLAVFWAPLALLGLHAFLAGPPAAEPALHPESRGGRLQAARWPWLVLFGAAWGLQGASNGYMLVFFSVLVGLWVLWFVIPARRWVELGMIAAAAVVAVLPLAPVLLRFIEAHGRYGFERPREEIAFYAADVVSVACPDPDSPTWSWFQAACRPEASGEQYIFTGASILVLCAVGAWFARSRAPLGSRGRLDRGMTWASRLFLAASVLMFLAALSVAVWGAWRLDAGPLRLSSSSVIRPFTIAGLLLVGSFLTSRWLRTLPRQASVVGFYVVGAVVMLSLSWGPSPRLFGQPALESGPFEWLMAVPGITSLRAPARFFMMTTLCLSVVMGMTLAIPLRRWRPPAVAAFVVLAGAGLLADGWQTMPAAVVPTSVLEPERVRGGVTLELPLGAPGWDAPAAVDAVSGGWSTINGYSGYEPQHYFALRETITRRNPALLRSMLALTDLHIVWDGIDPTYVPLVESLPGVQLVARRGSRRQYFVPRSGTLPPAVPEGRRQAIQTVAADCFAGDASLVTDGDLQTRWHCGAQSSDQRITADLGRPVRVGAIIPALGPYWRDYPRDLLIETSVDGVRWEPAWSGDVHGQMFVSVLDDPGALRMVLGFAPRDARFVRLQAQSSDDVWYWSIAELEIWSGGDSGR